MIFQTEKAGENSTYFLTAGFTNSNGDSVTPTSIKWSLTDIAGNTINSRADQVVTPAANIVVTLSGDDLALADEDKPVRILTVTWVYDDAPLSQTGLTVIEQTAFEIEALT